jgi:TRAP-type C4-dicarboxylate transport system substrate-binding protein
MRPLTKTLKATLAATTSAAILSTAPVFAEDKIVLRAVGQPTASGMVQKNKEKPFFEGFAKRTGLPIEMDYKPIDTLGIKDTEQLRVMKSGLFDVMSIRMSQNSRDAPTLLGMDLVGQNPDFATGEKTTSAFFDTVDKRLQSQFGVKLLGVWPFGPQMLFCRKPITALADVKGLKVRVSDQNLSKFVESIGGTPVPLAIGETHQALSLGVVDCAITGPSSANSAGWPEVTTHQMPIGFQLAMNGYGMTLRSWNKLTPEQKKVVSAEFKSLADGNWQYSEELFVDALNCNAGKEPCTTGKKFNLVDVPVRPGDIEVVRKALTAVSFPTWAAICDASNPGCSTEWKKTVGPIVGVK